MQLKQLLCAFFACIILFAACKKDDETTTDEVVGTWDAATFVNSNCNDSAEDGTVQASALACNDVNTFVCTEISFEFKDDGTFTNEVTAIILGFDASETSTGTYTVTGDEVEICYSSGCVTGTIADGQMTITTTDDPDTGCDTDTILEKR